MASCSRVFPVKRSCVSQPLFGKRRRTTPSILSSIYLHHGPGSSSEDDSSDIDDQTEYDLQQARAKRRASTRKLFVAGDSELSKACSLYSDDDDCDSSRLCPLSMHSSSPQTPFISSVVSTGTGTTTAAMLPMRRKSLSSDITPPVGSCPPSSPVPRKYELASKHSVNPVNLASPCAVGSASSPVSRGSDLQARMRCFEYLVGSIDEAWARYCNATTNMEDQVYGYDVPTGITSDVDDDDDDDEDAYLSGSSNGTELTDYDTEVEHPHKRTLLTPLIQMSRPRLLLSGSICSNADDSLTPSGQLLALKDRLTKAKYFLQDLVDSDHDVDIACFWKRWDMIKYATIELVEDDDDDEVVESTIEDLEKGRVNAI